MENHGLQRVTSEQDCNNYGVIEGTSSSNHGDRQINNAAQKTTECKKRSRSRLSATSSQSLGHPYDPRLYGYDSLPFSRSALPIPPHLFGSLANNAVLSSSNDNNNCNKSRPASYSTAIETQQHSSSQHQFHRIGIPAYVPNPYFNLQTKCNLKISNCASASLPMILPTCRRNSTTAVFQDMADLHSQPMSSFHPQYLSCQPSRFQKILQSHPSIYSHHNRVLNQVSFRRDRYSVGGPLTTIEAASIAAQHRHGLIPAVHKVPVSREILNEQTASADEDADDVFDDSLPNSALNSTTDPAFYREKLRDSRKRSMNSPNLTTRSKFLCQGNETMTSNAHSGFRNHDINKGDSNTQKPKWHQTVDFPCGVFPQSDPNMPCSSKPHTAEIVGSIKAVKKEVSQLNDIRGNQPLKSSSMPKTVLQLKASSVHGLTPILKNAKAKNQKHLIVDSEKADKVHGLQGRGSFEAYKGNSCSSSLKLKKQVVWKDILTKKEKNESSCKDTDDKTTNMIKCDLLTEQNLSTVKHHESSFSTKDRIGPYLFGPQLGTSPVRSITQFLVRKKGSFKYYMAKVLNMAGNSCDDKSGRMLLYSEHSLLTFLKDHPGVIREHGFHKDVALNPTTGKGHDRLTLILDCLTSHSFDPETDDYDNLQQYLIKVKKMSERETIRIFISIVKIVASLHELNVVHRDLKLGNMVLLRKSRTVILTNFGLGRHLISDGELLKDRRGSPAYISPDVLSYKPYTGKPSDMWSLGVVLFMMLYRQFPFYDQEPKKLFQKIKKVDFVMPSNSHVSSQINEVIYGLLTFDPTQRLTAGATLSALHQCASSWNRIQFSQLDIQVVPDIDDNTLSNSEEKEQMETDEKFSEENSTYEFRMINDDDDLMDKRLQGFGRQSCQSTLPTIQYCVYDARPLTENEMVMHRQLLVNSSPGLRVQEISETSPYN